MKNRDREIIRLRQEEKLTIREIAEKIELSRTAVCAILNDNGLTGRIPKFKLPKNLDGFSEEELSTRFGLTLSAVQIAKRKEQERKMGIRLSNRRKRLANYLFNLTPGYRFSEFLETLINNFSERKREILLNFYVRGCSESSSSNINSDSERVYRSNCRKALKEITKSYLIEELIDQEVLNGATRI